MALMWALREWCRGTCAGYPSVEIENFTSSFRDGLAFCAIIHKHRPDLIDFRSLSKVNAHQNIRLAFEVAEAKLGIPALLGPKDVVSCQVPDCLSIVSYLSQYYSFFSSGPNAGPASLRHLHITEFSYTKTKSPGDLKRSAHLETSKALFSSTHPQTVCRLCFKRVHLIQRHVADGEIYHRSCFRCKMCHCTLLPEFYTQGSEAGSLICIHHTTDCKSVRVDFSRQIGSAHNEPKSTFQASYISLSGLAISSIPHYTMNTEAQDKLVHATAKTEMKDGQERIREEQDGESCSSALRSGVKTPAPRGNDGAGAERGGPTAEARRLRQEAAETEQPCARVTGGSGRPVPAPRRMLDSASAPVPAPRVKTSQTSSRAAAGNAANQCKSPPISPHSACPTGVDPKVKSHHPWLGIIHPGPWTQLPPAPPLVAPPQSRSSYNRQGPWYRPKVPPPNPFGEELEAKTCEEAAKQTKENVVCSGDAQKINVKSDNKAEPPDKPIPPKRRERGSANAVETSSELAGSAICGTDGSRLDATQDTLPRTVSVPAITSAHSQSSLQDGAEESVTSHHSKTCQALPPQRALAPGHGFPLIKRKVQTDQTVPSGDLQVEMRELNKQLEALEQRGVELEKNLRDSKSSSQREEEQMLIEWFSLIHKRHVLVRRDTELVYLRKQQNLEEKQADVEYDLRCLLNKPESDWSQEDRKREQQLMDELVGIIEQRNQIISSLDQDRQRERKDDALWETMMENKELQKEGLKEIKKSKGKSKPPNVFKMLSHKAESIKSNVDKGS